MSDCRPGNSALYVYHGLVLCREYCLYMTMLMVEGMSEMQNATKEETINMMQVITLL